MKTAFILVILFIVLTGSPLGQNSNETKEVTQLLDTLPNLDIEMNPYQVIKQKAEGTNVVWGGSIDPIVVKEHNSLIRKIDNKRDTIIELRFYCSHHYFRYLTPEKLANHKIKLEKKGWGHFIISLLFPDFTLKQGEGLKQRVESRPNTHCAVIGKVRGIEKKFNKRYIILESYYWFTFQQYYY